MPRASISGVRLPPCGLVSASTYLATSHSSSSFSLIQRYAKLRGLEKASPCCSKISNIFLIASGDNSGCEQLSFDANFSSSILLANYPSPPRIFLTQPPRKSS